jgi:hypothetical protein
MKKDKQLEIELRKEYNNYQSKAHPEDRMSFMDYVQGLGLFKGYKIKVRTTFDLDYKISFIKE